MEWVPGAAPDWPGATGAGTGAGPTVFPDRAIVRTILADVAPDTLSHGAVLIHEHLSLNAPCLDRLLGGARADQREMFLGSPDSPYFMQDVEVMVAEMQAAARDGVAAITDGGHADMGRSLELLREVSGKSGMPIIASGGYSTDPFIPPELADQTDDEIAEALAQSAAEERWGAGYAKTVPEFVPMLREASVGDDAIHAMTVDNPLRFLAFVPRSA